MSGITNGYLASELVISEMNHRWFNGLQVISTSLRLCRRDCRGEDDVLRRLRDIGDQVQAMAALHRRLSGAPATGEDFEAHCRALCLDLILSFGRFDVSPWLFMCDPGLPPAASQLLALLIVELMTNVLKHGRPQAEDGVVWILLKPYGLTHLELMVEDNFVPSGAPAQIPRMVQALTANLHGSLHIDQEPFYRTRVRIPIA